MLENILSSVRQGVERVQKRGEEVAQVARLKVEIFQLNRELDSSFARLGRSHYAGAEQGILQGIKDEIKKLEDEIKARERLIEELGHTEDETPEGSEVAMVPVHHEKAPQAAAPVDLHKPADDTAPPSERRG